MFGKPKTFLGIDIGAGGVKAVELKVEKNRPVLFTYGYTSSPVAVHEIWATPRSAMMDSRMSGGISENKQLPPSIDGAAVEELSATLSDVCRASKIQAREAVVSLPVSAVFHAIVSLPKVDKKDFDRILKAEVEKLLPYPLAETALDYQVLAPVDGGKVDRVLVNAVPRSLVSFYTRVFAGAKIKLLALETEAAALERSLVGRDQAVTMVVDIGAERTNFFIIDSAVPITYQSVEIGGNKINAVLARSLGIGDALAEAIKRDLFTSATANLKRETFLDLVLPLIEPIAKEIEYGFDLYLRQTGNENKRPEKIILAGGAGRLPYLPEYLGELFKIKCYLGDPWGRVVAPDSLKPVIHAIGPRMAVAIGLALRSVVQ